MNLLGGFSLNQRIYSKDSEKLTLEKITKIIKDWILLQVFHIDFPKEPQDTLFIPDLHSRRYIDSRSDEALLIKLKYLVDSGKSSSPELINDSKDYFIKILGYGSYLNLRQSTESGKFNSGAHKPYILLI